MLRKSVASLLVLVLLTVTSLCSAVGAQDQGLAPIKLLPPEEGKVDNGSPDVAPSSPQSNVIPPNPAGTQPEYILGPGDELNIIDPAMGTEDRPYTQRVLILPDGTCTIFPVGIVHAQGLTLQELMDQVNAKAAKFIVNPQIIVQVQRPRPITVYVLGDVLKPGLYDASRGGRGASAGFGAGYGFESFGGLVGEGETIGGYNPGAAEGIYAGGGVGLGGGGRTQQFKLMNALQAAGGLKDTADVRHIRVTRNDGKETIIANLWKLLVEGDVSQDIQLQAGDVVFVHRGGRNTDTEVLRSTVAQRKEVRVLGAVKRPGLYYLTPDDDVFSIIARAEGFTEYAIKKKVLLSRLNPDGTLFTKMINIDKQLRDRHSIARDPVMPGDVVVVAESLAKKALPKVIDRTAITGAAILVLFLNTVFQRAFFPPQTQTSNTSPGSIAPGFL